MDCDSEETYSFQTHPTDHIQESTSESNEVESTQYLSQEEALH
jgi:hypothetical protein